MQNKHNVTRFPIDNIVMSCKKNSVSMELVERFKKLHEKKFGDLL